MFEDTIEIECSLSFWVVLLGLLGVEDYCVGEWGGWGGWGGWGLEGFCCEEGEDLDCLGLLEAEIGVELGCWGKGGG